MPRASTPADCTGRLRAVLSCGALLILTGCASGGTTPMGDTFATLWPDRQAAVAQAEALPYASLAFRSGDLSGLLVLGAEAGETTFWPTGHGGLIALYREGLQATSGLPEDLLDSRHAPAFAEGEAEGETFVPWRQATPPPFTLTRSWQRADGSVARQSARGELACEAPQVRELPLTSLPLQRCTQRLSWDDGRLTTGTLWRDPETLRLWAVQEQAWPEGPVIEWEVARRWW